MHPADVLAAHEAQLLEYEKAEIMEYPNVWYIGNPAKKLRARQKPSGEQRLREGEKPAGWKVGVSNSGFDDERGDYLLVNHDHIGYRYEVLGALGKGSFGQVRAVEIR
jgi:dual specificity tyrosine-phosphorylation-regulated kinase 2/3/4